MQTVQQRNPWAWIPSLYFTQGMPYVIVMSVAGTMYKLLGMSNAEMALYTSWLYLPWVIKPLWSPFVDMFGTKRFWVVALQAVIGCSLAMVAFTTKLPQFVQMSLAIFWLMAFSSATHDIAADGFYILAQNQGQQAAFVGVRSTFYRIAMVFGNGVVVSAAGKLAEVSGDTALAWSIILAVLGGMFGVLFIYHQFILPKPVADVPCARSDSFWRDYGATFASFFKRRDIGLVLGFLLTYRLGESQLIKLVTPFLLDPVAKGGLGMSATQVGFSYGTIGVLSLTAGGLFGGYVISRLGLKRSLWLMVLSVHLPDLVFVFLATALPQNTILVTLCIAIEQFGYGFGFTAYMLYMIMVADGDHKTSHYAICTGIMALGMMLPGMASGWIQEQLGYQHFFIWVCVATIPAFVMAALVKIDPAFGKA